MDLKISQHNLKVFAQAVQCLAKIGKELFLEVDENQMVMRTLNDAKSAFSAFYFKRDSFFDDFQTNAEDQGSFTCKVQLKAVQGVLRTLRRVLSLRLHVEFVDGIEQRLVLELECEFGIRKRHSFQLQECEIIHAVFHREGANMVSMSASQLIRLFDHIYNTSEVLLMASPEEFTLRSFRNMDSFNRNYENVSLSGGLTTEMKLKPEDFDHYSFQGEEEEVHLVFAIRDVKSALTFCEGTNSPSLSILFHSGGLPILFTCENGGVLIELVLATNQPEMIDAADFSNTQAPVPPPQPEEEEEEN